MDNLALQIMDDEISQEGFKIDNDNLAEWAITKIAEDTAEFQRLINVCESRILEYQNKIKKYQEQLENKTSGLKNLLMQYFETVPHKESKTQETYKLPSGTLKKKYGTPKYEVDDKALVKWLKESNMNNYIKVEEKPQWGELKKTITIKSGKIITTDGEVVEGVTAIDRPDSFEVEI